MFKPRYKVIATIDESVHSPDVARTIADVFKCAPVVVESASLNGESSGSVSVNDIEPALNESDTSAQQIAVEEDAVKVDANATTEETENPIDPEQLRIALKASILHRPLWNDAVEPAHENWSAVFIPGLRSFLPQFFRDLDNLFKPAFGRDVAVDELNIGTLELRIDPYVFEFTLGDDGTVQGDIVDTVECFRESLNEGAFSPYEVERVVIPPASSAESDAVDADTSPDDIWFVSVRDTVNPDTARLFDRIEKCWLE